LARLVGRDYDWIEFLVIPNEGLRPDRDEVAALTASTRGVMGPDCRLDISFVSQLARSGSDKWRYAVCDVTR
jgi:hypothetical protein